MPRQQVGLVGAVAIGLASMLGAGVFVVFHAAYAITPTGYYWALGLAALVAAINSWSIYSLARAIDRPGGVYSYSRRYLGDGFSFASGFAFVFGKIGSIAAIALAFNNYLAPSFRFWPAALAILALAGINILGIQRTAGVAVFLASVTLVFFSFFAVAGLVTPAPVLVLPAPNAAPALFDVLSAAAIFFFAFAGYARVATLGDEVRDAKRNIPKAIVIALSLVMVLYFVLAFVMQKFLGLDLFTDAAPFKALGRFLVPGADGWVSVGSQVSYSVAGNLVTGAVVVVAVLASLGSMLALLAGVSRTAASMGEDRELPGLFTRRNRHGSPWLAELVIAVGAIGLVAVGDLSWVIGFSSFSVLFYYSIGHLSVLRQPAAERVIPSWVAVAGFLLCWALAFTVPGPAVPVSLVILALAIGVRVWVLSRRSSNPVGNTAIERLAVYGTLQPGEVNHHEVSMIQGRWFKGTVRGHLLPNGWGAALGFPALELDETGPEVAVQILESDQLGSHWSRLDEFEGEGYQRVLVSAQTPDGQVQAWLYQLKR